MIEARAPVRACDLGGWTDTWFGGPGRVLNVAVAPGVEVSIRKTGARGSVVLTVDSFGDSYPVVPGEVRPPRHPLLEAAIDAFPPPKDLGIEIGVRAAVPPGCGTGTSAAVAVALLGALAAVRSETLAPRDAAYAAHGLEVEVLGAESGIQDQLSVAFGGINYLEVDAYPEATVESLPSWEALDTRSTLVFLGRGHDSSAVHSQVIADAGAHRSAVLDRLRDAAVAAREAVLTQDLEAFGLAMVTNTDAQRSLHSKLVSRDAMRLIDLAAGSGALGWKINGAGGDGGSVTVLSASPEARASFEDHLSGTGFRVLPVGTSPNGLEVRGAL